jgi:histidinol-phosphate/aromatic aminotransferase/cobyric acid decarboxylase-like protein
VWLDETYIDYAGPGQSLEQVAARSKNLVVCKSLSKVCALSGVRVGYLCGPPQLIEDLRPLVPPYAVSLPAQVAGVMALQDPDYYQGRHADTHVLRADLQAGLEALGLEVIPSVANFVLCHLPARGPDAATITAHCRAHGLFLRNVAGLSRQLGGHAIRLAVKDRGTNRKMLEVLGRVLGEADGRG